MSEVSSSGFVIPAAYSEEWRDITLVQRRSHTVIYTASRYGRRFVLKALPKEEGHLTDYRLQQEQEFLLGIQPVHPNIAGTYSLEEVKGIGRCIVQEWIDGVTLGEWLTSRPSRASRERVAGQLLNVLEYLHGLQLVHHDLKADNILITRNGTNVKLIDFGLSALDSTRTHIKNDARADIQALGRLLAVLLPHQRLLVRRCQEGSYANIPALRRAIQRRRTLIRLIPTLISALLLIAAATFFYLSWHERHKEQRRYHAMVALVETYIEQEREELSNAQEEIDYYVGVRNRYWQIRDSLMDTYPATDPLREQLFQLWTHRECDLDAEQFPNNE